MPDKLTAIKLVAPVINEGISVKQAISKRHTTREFLSQPLSLKNLSELMWAAYGINRKATRGRTAPAAWGIYPLEIYAIMEEGTYLYDPEEHKLNPVAKGDFRTDSGFQEFAGKAPLDIAIYVDPGKVKIDDPELQKLIDGNLDRITALDAGAVTENVYLYCASTGINVVERIYVDGDKLRSSIGLPDNRKFIVALTVGYTPE